ncbi:PAS domain-containing protein [Azospirillum sp. RWY-5-1]|uniref:histidine kinase n=2 Tax=Azospirillum oleiclasticum TaxID=2735135 RepID=A0ABX2TJF7_9PROT|nr:PAS domain-containing protein [Azospirillum oleiclasticum]NYZ24162.1 PAS domain-containing protein [Azospirillum oleiclasticum]
MGRMIRDHDWAATPLGSPEGWPPALRAALSICLGATIPTAIYWGPELRLLYNDAWAPIPAERHPWALGRPAREVWSDIWHVVGPQFGRAMDAGEGFTTYDQMLPMERGGAVRETYWNYSFTPIRDDDGTVVGVFNQGNETTTRILTERALRQSEERLALALAAANSVGIWDWDVRADVVTTDARFARLYGVEPAPTGANAPLKDFFARIHPDDAARVESALAEALRSGDEFAEEYRLLAPDGSVRWVAAQGRCTLAEDGTPLRFPGITLDITRRRQTEEALREGEARLRAITDSIDHMVWSTRPDGFHDYFNQRWYDFTGVTPGTTDGGGWMGLFHPDDHERTRVAWAHSLSTGEPYRIEYRLRHRSGAWRWVLGRAQPVRDADGRIVRWYGTCTDIQDIVDAREVLARSREDLERQIEARTQELMRAEEAMRQLQKMEAVGQLTGGIAHDFNNMLAVVLGGLSLMERRLARGDTDVGRYLEGAKDGALRAAALTQRLLAFSRQQPLAPEPLDANRLVTGMTELLTRTLGEHIRVETVLSAGLWRIHADASQLENAVLNLSVNARDAMPAGGRLTIETANAHMDDRYAAEHAIPAGQYVLIAVSDTGTGMEPAVAARAFDPFFTTKSVGRGTGLGLSQVFGFVRQSGGHVKIYSEVGVGTTVKLYLPRFYGTAQPAAVRRAAPPPGLGHPSEVVLVVEDDDRVRAWSVEALRELGYTVLHAANGPEALTRLQAGQAIDLLFTDVVMPDMTGRELADRALALLPDLKVLFTTGYTRNAIVHNGMLDPGTNFLPKPFSLDQLAAKVRSVLDG